MVSWQNYDENDGPRLTTVSKNPRVLSVMLSSMTDEYEEVRIWWLSFSGSWLGVQFDQAFWIGLKSYDDTEVRLNHRRSSTWRLKSRASYGKASVDKDLIGDSYSAFVRPAGEFQLGSKKNNLD